jgi:signal transduction histidine kinase
MKQKINRLSKRYAKALRRHLKDGPRPGFKTALGLGRLAVALGLETLELARIHEQALGLLKLPASHNGTVEKAEKFFTEALTPIVETHRPARQSKIDLKRLNEALKQRTLELADTNRHLQRFVLRRRSVESALKKSGDHYSRLLKDSLHIQEGLRQLTHEVLASQEEERRKLSHELQDEIAQTLLGINVRLVSLRQESRSNTTDLRKEIASTQRLVVKSAKSVRRAACRFSKP